MNKSSASSKQVMSVGGIRSIAATLLCAMALAGCSRADESTRHAEKPLHVYAAASTTDVMTAIAEAFTAETGIAVECSFASSSTLARQIEHGAPADVFLSADEQWMNRLEHASLLDATSRTDLLSNRLVVVAPANGVFNLSLGAGQQLPDQVAGRITIGDPQHVPAGRYAKQALDSLGWWDALESRIVAAADARAAVAFVEQGAVDAGIVYATDARASDDVVIVAELPADSHVQIVYPVARTTSADARAAQFMDYLRTAPASDVFRDAGFTVIH